MKLLHLSDLHLGKLVNGFSMVEDQKYILKQILEITAAEHPDAVLIAGDVYDKAIPSEGAVLALDEFLVGLSDVCPQIFLISGNHDSAERLAFGGRLMRPGIHVSPVYEGAVAPVTLEDEYGPADVWLLPFVKPAQVRHSFPEEEIASYTDAVACAVRHMPLDPARRNILVSHQFVTGAQRCQSEELSVGGTDNVDSAVFDPFDYVALGHIHGPQQVGRPTVRYCGTPLKYSFSELNHKKSVTVVELAEKGRVELRTVPLTPARDLAELRGTYADLTGPDAAEKCAAQKDCYLRIVLTDEQEVFNAAEELRKHYPYMMALEYDNTRTRSSFTLDTPDKVEERSPLELFDELFTKQNGRPMEEAERVCLAGILERAQEEQG